MLQVTLFEHGRKSFDSDPFFSGNEENRHRSTNLKFLSKQPDSFQCKYMQQREKTLPQIVLLPRKCKSNFCSSDTRQTIISAVRKFPPRNFSSPTYLRFYKHRGMALTHKHKLSFPFAHPLRSFPVRSQHDQPCSLAPPSFSMPLFSLLNCSCNINPERIKATRFLAERAEKAWPRVRSVAPQGEQRCDARSTRNFRVSKSGKSLPGERESKKFFLETSAGISQMSFS